VEQIRAQLSQRDATLVSLLAYAGLRPGEALALTWGCVRRRTILVERSIVLGQEKGTKTNATRTVRLLGPLAQDLAEWRLACRRPAADAYVLPRADGGAWRDADYRNWRKRKFVPTARAAGLESPRPYDLRHSFVSLLIQEGCSVVEVARQAGHSPEECLRTYAHVFEEFDPADRTPAEDRIRTARRSDVRVLYARGESELSATAGSGFAKGSRRPDSNRGPLHYENGRAVSGVCGCSRIWLKTANLTVCDQLGFAAVAGPCVAHPLPTELRVVSGPNRVSPKMLEPQGLLVEHVERSKWGIVEQVAAQKPAT
jgi:hypothetical protein